MGWTRSLKCLGAVWMIVLVAGRVAAAGEGGPGAPLSSPRARPVANEIIFPDDAGVVNVRTEFGAKGDGRTDDTAAIREAIKRGIDRTGRYGSPAFVYFPDGVYLVCGPLESKVAEDGWGGGWRAGMLLIGQSRERTVIRLKDSCEGYGDPKAARYVIGTGSESDRHGAGLSGGGNRAFRHSVINLTVDTGKGNPGAIGIDYVASNRGTIEDVTIGSGDGAGVVGLDLSRNWPGPALVKRVRIEGFDYGIRAAKHWQYGMTFEQIELEGQRRCAILNERNALFMRGVRSANAVPAVVNEDAAGLVVLLDSELLGRGGAKAAVENAGILFARNIRCPGYAVAIDDRTKADRDIAGPEVTEYASSVVGEGTSLNLPIEETPEFHTADLSQWESVIGHGATPGGAAHPEGGKNDDTDGIQAAIDAGKPIVYLPNGNYTATRTIVIRGGVRKIIGMQSSIAPPKDQQVEPLFRFESCGGDAVVMEHLRLAGAVEHSSKQALAIRHCDIRGGVYNTEKGTGKLFMEDVIARPAVRILHPQSAWLRQINPEWGFDPWIENHGGTLWILGMKTEGKATAIRTVRGRTELLGGLFYREEKWQGPDDVPLLVVEDGDLTACYVRNGRVYPTQFMEQRGQEKRTLKARDIPGRGPALLLGVRQGD